MNQITSNASAPIVAVFESAQSIRIIMIANEPWFAVSDVCDILGYANSRKTVADHCREGGVTKRDTIDSMGRMQPLTYISEGNLYRLVIKSRKPEAEKFEAWVCDEVLPSIRKTGGYVVPVAEPEPQYEEDSATISDYETERLKKMVGGIAYCLPTMTSIKVSAAIYGRIKSPLRIGRIDDLPAPYFDRTMQYLERACSDARQHNRKQRAIDEAFLNKMIAGSEVAA